MEQRDTIRKEYSNGEVTVVWQPSLCIHSTICWKAATGLPQVFNPRVRPWVNIQGAGTAQIVAQVQKCPSGALQFFYNNPQPGEMGNTAAENLVHVEVQRNGPLLVHGTIQVKDQNGTETQKQRTTAFCRCGQSRNKPYCDGSHSVMRIDG